MGEFEYFGRLQYRSTMHAYTYLHIIFIPLIYKQIAKQAMTRLWPNMIQSVVWKV